MEDHRWAALAARLRSAANLEDRRALPDAQESERERLRRARGALLDDLVVFAKAVSAFAVTSGPRGVSLRRGDRVLHFEPLGPADVVRVRGSKLMTGVHRLVWHPEREIWLYGTFNRDHVERYLPLFDEGLEELIAATLGLGAPAPAKVEPPRTWLLASIRRSA